MINYENNSQLQNVMNNDDNDDNNENIIKNIVNNNLKLNKYKTQNKLKSSNILYEEMSIKLVDFNIFLNKKVDNIINSVKENINKHKLYKPTTNFDINSLDNNYENLLKYNLNMNMLKCIAKKKNMKFSNMNKVTLLKNIFFNLYYSFFINKIQKTFRRYLYKSFIKLKGPAYKNKTLSTNTTDFVTLENICEIHPDEFFSILCGNEIYTFNINSIFSYIFKNNKSINPYNRKLFPPEIIKQVERYITLSKCLNKRINTSDDSCIKKFNKYKQLEFRALALFQTINEYDNYSDPKWFLNLSFKDTRQLAIEFIDIWNYRAELTSSMKIDIYPPDGNLFKSFNLNQIIKKNDIIFLKNNLLHLFESLINANSTLPNKKLGIMYILYSLTIVSNAAANALPYFYYSVI